MTSQKASRRRKREKERKRGDRQHLCAKSVGEVTADIGEHAPDFRSYPSTIDRADKILSAFAKRSTEREETDKKDRKTNT